MSAFYTKSHCFKFLILLFIPLLVFACSSGGGQTPTAVDEALDQGLPVEGALPASMGIVLDPLGNLVGSAVVAGIEITTSEGNFSGSLSAYPSGWVSIEALGYLTGYAKPFGKMKGVELFETRLTPLQTGVIFTDSTAASLSLILSTGYELQIELARGQFDAVPRAVQAAPIDPLDIGPFFEELDDGANLKIVTAFGLSSYDETLESVPLAAGASMPVFIMDSGALSDAVSLAVFNPDTGEWDVQQPGCQRENPETLACSLGTLSPLVAIFDAHTSAAFRKMTPLVFHHQDFLGAIIAWLDDLMRLDRLAAPPGDAASDYKAAKRAYEEYMDEHGEVDPNDPEGRKVLDDLIDSARRMAEASESEAGKFALLTAASAAMESGDPATGEQFVREASDIADRLAKKDLQELDCGEFRRLLKRAEQLMLLHDDEGLAQKLIDKATEMAVDCDVWRGTITVWMISSSRHPGGLDMQAKGTPSWFEYHTIQLWTNVKTYAMHGWDTIRLVFPEVTYVREGECRNDIKISGQPQGGQARLEYSGRYDGYEFQINEPPSASGGVSIAQRHHFELKTNNICMTATDYQVSAPNYSSVIAHGFEYGSPPINLQEILSEGSQGRYMEITTIRGSQDLNNPDPDTGKYPFILAHINWSILHVEPKLPIEE
jgi:hypothetical protein